MALEREEGDDLVEVLDEGVVDAAQRVDAVHLQPRGADARDARAHSARKAQNSCTCGSQAALTSRERPRASAAHSTKFSVVVTDA